MHIDDFHSRARALIGLIALATCIRSIPASAATIDGTLDGEYGLPLSTQTTETGFGDTSFGPIWQEGSELDQAFAHVEGGTLFLLFTGNLQPFASEPLTNPEQLEIFIDCVPGGQNPLRADNPAIGINLRLNDLAGLAFDADFSPDYWFEHSTARGGRSFAYYAELPAAGGGAGYFLGVNGSIYGTELTGGTNPHGIRVGLNETNEAGVTEGCGSASGAGVTTGFEWSIPLEAIGNPTGALKVCALVARYNAPRISNQLLGPVPPGTCALGAPADVNLASIPGEQYFVIDFAVPARRASFGYVKAKYAR